VEDVDGLGRRALERRPQPALLSHLCEWPGERAREWLIGVRHHTVRSEIVEAGLPEPI
jgi:hypothetical protein